MHYIKGRNPDEMPDIFALVDCNNFYASCERLFQPSLMKRPVIVLSNNDGCVIARSEEAKLLGIGMGRPAFEYQQLLSEEEVVVFSTNYTLYGDLSRRVMQVLTSLVPSVEIYSIDEAFLDLSFLSGAELFRFGKRIRSTVMQATGIPVSVGIGPTKTLAKAANHLAKKYNTGEGVTNLYSHSSFERQLELIPVSDVWGVGEQYDRFLQRTGIRNARDLKRSDPFRIREHLGVVGQRIVLELNGTCCYPLDENPLQKKEVCTSRSFGNPLLSLEDLLEATTTYAASVGNKLRDQQSRATSLLVFVMTNKYATGPQYVNYQMVHLSVPTNQTHVLIHHAAQLLRSIYKKGYRYKKSGVIASGLIPDQGKQVPLWEAVSDRRIRLEKTMDRINRRTGQGRVRYAVEGFGKSWKMKQENLSPRYTTQWQELPEVDMDRNP
jgi:DNA polymerase V